MNENLINVIFFLVDMSYSNHISLKKLKNVGGENGTK